MPTPSLEELKKATFPPEGKEERVARALAALHQPFGIDLPIEVLKRIVEDSDLEDQNAHTDQS